MKDGCAIAVIAVLILAAATSFAIAVYFLTFALLNS
jgi:hypothetical protein